jgi:zona occludens toxin
MAISIHHGPNGSYKTAGVIQDFFIPAAKEGRTVVTNIRGVSTDNTFEHLLDTHDDFDVIHVDTSTRLGRDKIARWFHWAPDGALLLFDEPAVIFPKRWRDSDLKKLDNLQVINRMEEDPTFNEDHPDYRPSTFNEAFEMHRHWNWDIVIMSPNIKLVRSDIRDTTEGAYKHRNNALIGFSGSYNEGFHKAEDNGTNPTQFLSVEKKKIDPVVFKLYKSTKTGKHQDTSSGTSIWKNGRLLVSLVVAVSALGYSAYGFIWGGAFSYETEIPDLNVSQTLQTVPEEGATQNSNIPSRSLDTVPVNQTYSLEPFQGHTFFITGYIYNSDRFLYHFNAVRGSDSFPITSDELIEAGYAVLPITDCAATIVYKTARYNVTCQSIQIEQGARGA